MARTLNIMADVMSEVDTVVETQLKSLLVRIARSLIDLSPLGIHADAPNGRYATGAYIASHEVSILGNPSTGQGISSKGRKPQSVPHDGGSGMINKIKNATKEQLMYVRFSNNSPHADIVETGGPNWRRRKGYHVYKRTADRFGVQQ